MKIIKVAAERFDMFSEEADRAHEKQMEKVREVTFRAQDELAEKSEAFRRVLDSEISDDPIERYRSTSDPKSKT